MILAIVVLGSAAALASAATLAGCRQKEMPAAAAARSFKDVDNGFALELPKGWAEAKMPATKGSFIHPLPGGAGNLFVSVVIEKAPARTLAELLQSSRKQFSRLAVYEEKRAELTRHAGGREAYLIEAITEGAPSGPGGGRESGLKRFKQYGFLLDGRQYLVTALMPSANSQDYLPLVDPVLDSLVIW